jgi:hypothetical protein
VLAAQWLLVPEPCTALVGVERGEPRVECGKPGYVEVAPHAAEQRGHRVILCAWHAVAAGIELKQEKVPPKVKRVFARRVQR